MLTSNSDQEKFLVKKKIDGIDTIYIKNTYNNKMGIALRLRSFLKFMFYATWIGLKQKNIDLVYATSTPLTVAFPAIIIKWIRGVQYVFEVRDLWPDVPVQMGAIKNKLLIKILYNIEQRIYKSAEHIVALSPGMYKGIMKYGISPRKVTMIPNMAKKDEFYERPRNITVAESFRIDLNRFNVVHFGSMGIANGLEYIIDAAIHLKDRQINNINFIFLGDGKTEESLRKKCRDADLDTVKFLGKHPMKMVSEIVNICDCSIVTFADIPILYTNSPNKLFDSLSAAKPLIVNSAGWTKQMVEEHRCGIYVDPKKPENLANTLVKMKNSPAWLKEMSDNSRWLAENVYDKSILCKEFYNVITHSIKKEQME